MADIASFKKHFLTTTADRLVKEKDKGVSEARELAEKRYKLLVDDQETFDEKYSEWAAAQPKPSAAAPAPDGAKKRKAKADDGDKKEKKPGKRKAKEPEDGAEAKPKVKRAKRLSPDEIPLPTKRVQLQTSIHLDKHGRMFFYNHKTNESSWQLPAHDFNVLFGPAVKELGYGGGGRGAKRGTRKSKLHGYHIFVKEYVPEVDIANPHEKGKERIRLAAKAWKLLTEPDKEPWKKKADKLNETVAAKEKADAAALEDGTAAPAAAAKAAPKAKKAAPSAKAAVDVKADGDLDFDW